LAGCSPAEPAAASPASASITDNGASGNHFAANGNLSLFHLSQPWGALQDMAGFSLGDFFIGFSPLNLVCLGPGFDAVRVFAGGRRVSRG
jgi:hypothetical protein